MSDNEVDFYLASTEGYGLEHPRKCFIIRRLSTETRQDLLLVRVVPPLIVQKRAIGSGDLELVVLATRHRGSTLFPIKEWPVYVHVARAKHVNSIEADIVSQDDLEVVAWGELYRTEEDARAAVT